MRPKPLTCCAGVLASAATWAFAQERPDLHRLDNAIQVEPVSIARARFADGRVERVSEWMPYGAAGRATCPDRVFSAFGDADSDGFPDDAGGCGLGSGRWFFGTGYCGSTFLTDDFNVDPCTDLSAGMCRADFAWYWTCDGFGIEECIVGVWTEDSNANECEVDSWDYSGWLLNFGSLSCNPGGYYYTNVDIGSVGTWPVPTGGSGSYPVMLLTSGGDEFATCAQFMFWGAPNASGGEPDGPGAAGPNLLDDFLDPPGVHTPDECVDMHLAVCPDPLQVMLQFWGTIDPDCSDSCAYADCTGDGEINTVDFLCFLNQWVAQYADADCDGNGIVNTQDFTCFLNIWAACRG